MANNDPASETRWYQQEWLKWAVPAGAAILGSVVTILVQQLFLPRTTTIKQKAALKKEIIKSQYPHILKIKRFANIGSKSYRTVFVRRYVNPEGNVIGEAEKGPEYFLPAVAHDQILRHEWHTLAEKIKDRKYLIDPGLYNEFNRIMKFVENNPLPDTATVRAIEQSAYSNPDKVATFTSLHEYLLTKANEMTGFE